MSFIIDWTRSFLDLFGLGNLLRKRANILFLGLDCAGKSTLLHMLVKDRLIFLEPTATPQKDEIVIGNVCFSTHDMGGHAAARRLWSQYTHGVSGIVWLVDGADRARFQEASMELHGLLDDEALKDVPFLLLCNKVDKAESVRDIDEFKQILDVTGQDEKRCHVEMCSVVKRQGFPEGFQWLAARM